MCHPCRWQGGIQIYGGKHQLTENRKYSTVYCVWWSLTIWPALDFERPNRTKKLQNGKVA